MCIEVWPSVYDGHDSRRPTGTLYYRRRPLDVRELTEAEHGQDGVAMGRIETQPFPARLLSSSAPSRS